MTAHGCGVVTLKAQYIYGDSQPYDKTYTCSYTEEWSPFSYLPEFYNLQRDDQKYGNVNGSYRRRYQRLDKNKRRQQ